jgi:hypothetical protein
MKNLLPHAFVKSWLRILSALGIGPGPSLRAARIIARTPARWDSPSRRRELVDRNARHG